MAKVPNAVEKKLPKLQPLE